MYYQGASTNKITIGRDMGWGAITQVDIHGNVSIGNGLIFLPKPGNSFGSNRYFKIRSWWCNRCR